MGIRTAERMLKLLETRDSLIKEQGDDNKKYFRLEKNNNFPSAYISENEIISFETIVGVINTNELLKLSLESLARKSEALKAGKTSNTEDLTLVKGTASASRPHIKVDRKILETLQDAILAFQMVKIEYKKLKKLKTNPFVSVLWDFDMIFKITI